MGQLRSLFFSEVVHRTESLCYTKNATFGFQAATTLPVNEMTGFRIPAAEVANQGMRGISGSSNKYH